MKTKKNAKKNRKTFNNSVYTPGRNVFGEKAETHLIILKRETAFQQMMDAICQLDGSTKEFTFDMRCFDGHEEELNQLMAKVQAFLAMKARISRKPLYDCSCWLNGVA
jgi:hypothetical protein